MALGAAHGGAQPDVADRADAVGAVLGEVFLGLNAAFGRGAGQAIEGGGDLLVRGRVRHQVAGELLAGELVERHVVAEGAQDVVPVRPSRIRIVAVKAGRVGVAHGVEPVNRHLLGVRRRGEQPVDQPLVGIRRLVFDESLHLGWLRRQARQVERDAADQRAASGLRGGREAVALQALLNEGVDRVADRGSGDRRHGRSLHRHVRPVALVLRAFGDPLPDGLFLRLGQRLVAVGRRHELGGRGGEDALNDGALIGIAGNDRGDPGAGRLERLLAQVEPHARHPRALVRTVAAEARVGHDGPDVLVKADFGGAGGGRKQRAGQRDGANGAQIRQRPPLLSGSPRFPLV